MKHDKNITSDTNVMMSPGLDIALDVQDEYEDDSTVDTHVVDVTILSNGVHKVITGELITFSLQNRTLSDCVLEMIVMINRDCIDDVLGFNKIVTVNVSKAGKSMKTWTFVSKMGNEISVESNPIGSTLKLVGTVI